MNGKKTDPEVMKQIWRLIREDNYKYREVEEIFGFSIGKIAKIVSKLDTPATKEVKLREFIVTGKFGPFIVKRYVNPNAAAGRRGHHPEMIAQVCEMIEERGLTHAQVAELVGLNQIQVQNIAQHNGARKGESLGVK